MAKGKNTTGVYATFLPPHFHIMIWLAGCKPNVKVFINRCIAKIATENIILNVRNKYLQHDLNNFRNNTSLECLFKY